MIGILLGIDPAPTHDFSMARKVSFDVKDEEQEELSSPLIDDQKFIKLCRSKDVYYMTAIGILESMKVGVPVTSRVIQENTGQSILNIQRACRVLKEYGLINVAHNGARNQYRRKNV